MELFLCVLADIVHFFKIILICNIFFGFRKRYVNNKYWILFVTSLMLVVTSIAIYVLNDRILETAIYVVMINLQLFLLYKEKINKVVLVAVSTVFALSMIDTMVYAMIDILLILFNLTINTIYHFLVALISFAFVFVVGKAYKKNVERTIQIIGYADLIGFAILLAFDTFVVSAIVTQPIVDSNIADARNMYLIAVVFVIIGIFVQLASVILLFTQRNVYKEKEELTDKYLNEQKNHYEYLEEREKETRKFRHDLRNHMEMISKLAKEQQYDKMNAYLEQMNIKIDDFGNVVTVHNGIVDAVINQYYAKAQECGVNMEVKGRFPVDCAIDAFDLCTIFSNVLSNALEAAKETEEKHISVECAYTDMVIMLIVSNSYKPDGSGGGQLRTRKSDLNYHGYGLENVKDSVKKYKGDLDIETKDNIFTMRILFKNMEKQVDENSDYR